jgi:hypothetical protein
MPIIADIIEPAAADPRIAMAENWLCMLGGLREVARRFGRFLFHELLPDRPRLKAPALWFLYYIDPAAAFKRVALAAGFAAQLCLRIEKEIAAFKAGEPCDLDGFLARTPPPGARSKSDLEAAAHETERLENLNGFKNWMEREPPERYDFLRGANRKSQEERYAALLNGPLKTAIAAICADLRLKPNWRLWTDNGFPPAAGGAPEDWVAFFVPDADKAAAAADDSRGPLGDRRIVWRSTLPPLPPPYRDTRAPPLYAGATRPPDRGRLPDHPSGVTDTHGLPGAATPPGP